MFAPALAIWLMRAAAGLAQRREQRRAGLRYPS
jgi:hypothetical protein